MLAAAEAATRYDKTVSLTKYAAIFAQRGLRMRSLAPAGRPAVVDVRKLASKPAKGAKLPHRLLIPGLLSGYICSTTTKQLCAKHPGLRSSTFGWSSCSVRIEMRLHDQCMCSTYRCWLSHQLVIILHSRCSTPATSPVVTCKE